MTPAERKNPRRARLRRCPCCGGRAAWRPTGMAPALHMRHAVWCTECNLQTQWYRLAAVALGRWQRRPDQRALDKEDQAINHINEARRKANV